MKTLKKTTTLKTSELSTPVVYGVIFIIWVVFTGLMTLWSDRNLDWLASTIKHQPTDIPLWLSFIFALLPISPWFNVICEFLRSFM